MLTIRTKIFLREEAAERLICASGHTPRLAVEADDASLLDLEVRAEHFLVSLLPVANAWTHVLTHTPAILALGGYELHLLQELVVSFKRRLLLQLHFQGV